MSPEHHNNSSAPGNVTHTAQNLSKLTLNTKEANEKASKATCEVSSAGGSGGGDSIGFSDGGDYSITPTELMDPIFETRRSSAGSILSADVIDRAGGLQEPDFSAESSDRFYLLKKDSQRRLTLVKVLQLDKLPIIDSWFRLIEEASTASVAMTKDDLSVLMEGIRDYLPEQNKAPLQKAISHVQAEHASDVGGNFADFLSLAMYKFEDAVSSTLRRHKIKPHWMFALDSLVRNAVKQSLNMLSPAEDIGAPGLMESTSDHLEFPFEEPKMCVTSSSPSPPQSLQKSLGLVQNFIKNLAFELESNRSGANSQPR